MKKAHITTASGFKEALSMGKKWKSPHFSLISLLKEETKSLAIGLVIAKRQYPKATQRNYIRRRIYSFFNEQETSFEGLVVVKADKTIQKTAKKSISGLINGEMEALCRKAGIIS